MSQGYHHADPFESSYLRVDDIHLIHYAQYGNPDGRSVIFLHGGPGGSTSRASTRFFDPRLWHVVLFDQRGAGLSTPRNELRDNTSQHLILDIEALREHLGIEKWFLVFGGSWGSALGLLYSQTFPSRVQNIVLRGVTTASREELRFNRQSDSGVARMFPEEYHRFVSHLPEEMRGDPLAGYYKMLTSNKPDEVGDAAQAFSRWDLTLTARFGERPDHSKLSDDEWCLTHALLETHHYSHGCWLEDGQLLRDMPKIAHINGVIVQGAKDFICPPWMAWSIHKSWPNSELQIIDNAGHSDSEPLIEKALIEACDHLGRMV